MSNTLLCVKPVKMSAIRQSVLSGVGTYLQHTPNISSLSRGIPFGDHSKPSAGLKGGEMNRILKSKKKKSDKQEKTWNKKYVRVVLTSK